MVNGESSHVHYALGFSGTGLEWVVNAYPLTFGGLMLLGGGAGDLFGRAFLVAAGIMLLAALITAATIRSRTADLAGVNPS